MHAGQEQGQQLAVLVGSTLNALRSLGDRVRQRKREARQPRHLRFHLRQELVHQPQHGVRQLRPRRHVEKQRRQLGSFASHLLPCGANLLHRNHNLLLHLSPGRLAPSVADEGRGQAPGGAKDSGKLLLGGDGAGGGPRHGAPTAPCLSGSCGLHHRCCCCGLPRSRGICSSLAHGLLLFNPLLRSLLSSRLGSSFCGRFGS